ncbi:hypothetical protein PuT2_01160 [Pusillimonas sp. T2]|uniref:c-type cytochrome n=1 Tax=Pusillimonas sp. T2 TaxID=1548123 RepID=UPI000B9CCEDF|nr:c-type cytochrome [Pusillimonas sp. T2]OXR50509.1 hypothetical protein PuT2_01160 [Pusillimonas sp. T2]
MKTLIKQLSTGVVSAVGLLVLGLSAPAQAQSTFDVTVLAAACANCHGTDGRSPGGMPSLAGRPEAVLKAQLMAYKSDTPPAGTTVMNRLAKGYSDDELAALAKHFSQIKPQATNKN